MFGCEDNIYEKELEWAEVIACWFAGNAFMQRASQQEALSPRQSGLGQPHDTTGSVKASVKRERHGVHVIIVMRCMPCDQAEISI